MQKKLSVLMLLGFVLSIPFAKFFPELTIKSKFLGSYFIYLLKSFVPFLIFGTITFSIASFESGTKLKKIVPLTLLFYITSTFIAIIYALSIASNINFASDQDLNIGASLVQTDSLSLKSSLSIIAIDLSNFFSLTLEGNPIAIMILSVILGLLLRIRFTYQKKVIDFFSYINNLVINITNYLMLLAPIAIFSLFSNLLVDIDNNLLFSLLRFVVICIFVFLFYMFFFYGLIIKYFVKFNPIKFFLLIKDTLIFAFFSSSSAATMPLTLKTAEQKLKIKKEISSFVVPIGATVNMDGSAIYLGLSAVFMAQLLNLSLSIDQYVIISLTATIGSIGAAGVTSVALVMMTIVFSSIGIPIEAIAIIAGVDRLLDMFRTSINVAGDLTISKLVDKISRN